MKKTYTRPQIMIEAFTPNNYVAACYKIACDIGSTVGSKNTLSSTLWNGNKEFGWGVTHSKLGTAHTCADETANRVLTDEGGLLSGTSVGEYNGQQGWIKGGIDNWDDKNKNGVVDTGDIIYWHTFSSDNKRRWNHRGTIQGTVAGHPNHS